MTRGFSLAEMLLALVVLALLLGLGAPRLRAAGDRLAVGRAADRVALAHRRARTLALVHQGPVRLVLAADTLAARGMEPGAPAWGAAGPAADGAALEPALDSVTYAPNGLAVGAANGRYVVRRGGMAAEVLVSRLGRVRVLRTSP
jgi:prepilin-type N-terminal cleavage/methylation domain-containing protein